MFLKEKKWRWGDEKKVDAKPVSEEDNPSFTSVLEMLKNEDLKEVERLENFFRKQKKKIVDLLDTRGGGGRSGR